MEKSGSFTPDPAVLLRGSRCQPQIVKSRNPCTGALAPETFLGICTMPSD